ncbi:MAG: hypothetical protein BM485_04145 [Desulfobulbaceae bacterium DB1]|nr:MAG: hypothetical protein BM485_04145 [Desulfobulbaceae bacterium DB1]
MPADERVRITFRRVFVRRDADTFGSGEWYFHASVDGTNVGERSRIFNAVEQRFINFEPAQWRAEVNVRDGHEIHLRFAAYDEDVINDDHLGTIDVNLTPLRQGTWRRSTGYYTVEWTVELSVLGRFARHTPPTIFATRQHHGSVTCTTVSGATHEARFELCPVRPVPPDGSLPSRPPLSPSAALLPAQRCTDLNVIAPGDNINIIPNPAVIPILAAVEATNQTAARIEFTYYHPGSLNFTDDDPRLEWSVVSVAGGGAVDFVGRPRGRRVLVYGTHEGEVRLEVRFQGALFAQYRALVRSIRQIPFRANILNGPGRSSQPRATPDNVRAHLDIVNRILRQAALELVPDTNTTRTHSARATDHDGIFRISVTAGRTRRIADTGFAVATRLNYRRGVFNFAYIHSDAGGNLGAATDYPANGAGATITDNGSPSTSWILPSGVDPDGAAGTVTMNLLAARERNTGTYPQLAAMYVTDANGDPANAAAQFTYAGTIAHELGHVLALGHRVEGVPESAPGAGDQRDMTAADAPAALVAGGIFWDGLLVPPGENVMHWINPTTQAQDFDIIQARAMHQSPVVPP